METKHDPLDPAVRLVLVLDDRPALSPALFPVYAAPRPVALSTLLTGGQWRPRDVIGIGNLTAAAGSSGLTMALALLPGLLLLALLLLLLVRARLEYSRNHTV